MQKGSFCLFVCLFVRILINIKSFWEVLHVGRILRNNKKNLIQNVREQWISITIITMITMITMITIITMFTMFTMITIIITIKNPNVREWWISITRAKGQQHHQHNNHCKCFYFLSFQLKRAFNIKPWLSLYSCFSSWKGWSLCLSLGDFQQSFRKR